MVFPRRKQRNTRGKSGRQHRFTRLFLSYDTIKILAHPHNGGRDEFRRGVPLENADPKETRRDPTKGCMVDGPHGLPPTVSHIITLLPISTYNCRQTIQTPHTMTAAWG
jgi:hypothetical protein